MSRIVLQPAANAPAQRNYEATIRNAVPLERIEPHVSETVFDALLRLYPGGETWVWGTTPGKRNDRYFAEMSPGDLALFYQRGEFYSAATVTLID